MVDRIGRVTAPAATGLFAIIAAALGDRSPVTTVVCLVVVASAVAVLLDHERRPRAALVAVAGVIAAVGVLAWGEDNNLGWFAYCVLAGWVALRSGWSQLVAVVLVMVVILSIQWIQSSDQAGWGAWLSGTLFTAVIGGFVQRQARLIRQLQEAQAGLAERTRAEERNRIAREVHDVIGHSLTVSLLHVTSARLALDDDLDEARTALEEAERLGRQSLTEVRQVVAMSHDEGANGHAPMPGAAEIETLVESVTRTGTPIALEVLGDRSRLTATGGLAVYRILQESLTNVARHAPGAAATVRLEVGPTDTRLLVDSAGPPGPPSSGTHGVVGMQERAEALGGRLVAGPHDGGWRVEAVLPA